MLIFSCWRRCSSCCSINFALIRSASPLNKIDENSAVSLSVSSPTTMSTGLMHLICPHSSVASCSIKRRLKLSTSQRCSETSSRKACSSDGPDPSVAASPACNAERARSASTNSSCSTKLCLKRSTSSWCSETNWRKNSSSDGPAPNATAPAACNAEKALSASTNSSCSSRRCLSRPISPACSATTSRQASSFDDEVVQSAWCSAISC
mmetsp:Transcript_111241/g.313966  ORF Transcript_111241/g.313966 Transcript_111241/m.313966 type:complete len:208 (+) Transcript_111241:706-1329(+)